MRTIIIEDDPLDRNTLTAQLAALNPAVEVVAACDNTDDALVAISRLGPDLVFLDIELGGGENGFDLLKMFDRPDFAVVFTTHHNTNSNLLNAIRASALDFLVKPLLTNELEETLTQFYKKSRQDKELQLEILQKNIEAENNKIRNICIPGADGQTRLEVQNILYCEAANSSTHFHLVSPVVRKQLAFGREAALPGRKITSSKGIRFWEKIFCDSDILRVHNSFLVNINHVVRYKARLNGAVLVLSDGTELPVSKGRKDYLKERWTSHYRFHDHPTSN